MGSGCQPQNSVSKFDSSSNFHDCKLWINSSPPLPHSSSLSHSTSLPLAPSHLPPTFDFIFPEEQEEFFNTKSDIGIALSGGGYRAVSLSLGFLRGLNLLNLFSNAKYVSSNSGSSWLVGPLCYDRIHQTKNEKQIKTFLDPYYPPEECTRSNLRKCDPSGHSYAICKSKYLLTLLNKLNKDLIRYNPADPRGFWSQSVGQIFFKKYDLNSYDLLPTLSGSHSHEIHTRTTFPRAKMATCDLTKFPFPIINASIFTEGETMFAPAEFTPLYYGFPTQFEVHGKDSYHSGGYYIEPYGFLSNPHTSVAKEIKNQISTHLQSTTQQQPSQHIISRIPKPSTFASVSETAGMSSSAIAQVIAHGIDSTKGKQLDLSVYPIWDPIRGETHLSLFADGGGVDNTAILALIRRKVKKIIFLFATDQPFIDPRIDHTNYSHSNFACVAALFGVMTCDGDRTIENITVSGFNKLRHIFPSEDFAKLLNGLRARYVEGKPGSYLLRTTVLSNSHANIVGGFNVEVLFFVNAPSDNWINKLPKDIRKQVLIQRADVDKYLHHHNEYIDDIQNPDDGDKCEKKVDHDEETLHEIKSFIDNLPNKFEEDEKELKEFVDHMFHSSDFDSFPYVSTLKLDYSIQLVNLFSNLMCWEVLESKDLLEELYGHEIKLPTQMNSEG